jgi:predicted metal-binding protein
MTRIGIIRCSAYSKNCAGTKCFAALREKTGSFAGYPDEVQIVGFDTCGGCARNNFDKVVARAARLRENGAEVVHLSNCLVGACPWAEKFQQALVSAANMPIALRTHV